ncbi:facilitated trehalose transporter Tret1 [Acyrthosiphon pisum]|uniref:Major facilitator superfamily (MFS) profile domain-containing protein n=2 Tax=Acyrthosiphon pisum TaxID=7029 RepID=A0A8R1W2Y3_ACYPI|nr:facilitated trehalose transporter Tret1 [Acyrthosiphon pisum]|eukprot:XP_001951195.1 PREDICTED: facilitated trehalose transporter Tret1 [Acyrthosiphon pisum]
MEEKNKYDYGIKSTLAQCWAISGPWLLQIDLGIQVITSTIVIGVLENNTLNDKNEFLTITSEEASWFGSLQYLFTPLGNVLSLLLLDRLGHRECMILTNIPGLVAQIILYYAKNVEMLYASSSLMALSMGLLNAPCLGYTGEVCEPKLRGTLTSSMNIFYYMGTIILTMMYSITKQWRLTVILGTVFPILTIIIILTTPESPIWLLTNGKHSKANRNLRRLRGKVSHEKCENEFQEMIKYSVPAKSDEPNDKNDTNAWKQLLKPEVLRPFRLMMLYFFFKNLFSVLPLLPYLVSIFNKFAAPVNVEWTISFTMSLCMAGSVMAVFLIRTLGKRLLTLFSLSVCSVCYIMIGLIGVNWTNAEPLKSWIVLILFLINNLSASAGLMPIAWTLLSEIFPAKSKNIASNLSTVTFFVITFCMTKYYPDYSNLVEFYNVFTINGIIGIFGCIYFYFCLPETENKTLQEISEFFK